MKLRILVTLFFAFAVTVGFSQKKELKSITENELKAHLEFIASDYMQGRDFGTQIPGLEITAEYLKSQCLQMGLKPGGENFTQPVKMESIQSEKANTFIKLKNANGETRFKSNEISTFPGSLKNDTINAKIVFAGYGYKNTDTGYNDFDSLDLKDKAVLIMTRNLEVANDTLKEEDITKMEMGKLVHIFMSGAKAIILVSDPLNNDDSWFEMVKDYALQGTWQVEGSEQEVMPGNKIILANNAI